MSLFNVLISKTCQSAKQLEIKKSKTLNFKSSFKKYSLLCFRIWQIKMNVIKPNASLDVTKIASDKVLDQIQPKAQNKTKTK